MTYRIQTKKSNISELVPHPSELLPGELAVNYSDMVLYALGTDGNVHQISGSGGGGGDLVSMDYTFWVKTVAEGESAQLFTGTGDSGSTLAINLDGFDVALNGVSLDPNIDYTPDAVSVALTEPAQVGDVLIVRNLVPDDGVIQGEALNTSDISITSDDRPNYYEDHGLQTQQDVNWYLLDKFESIEVPELPDDIATTGDITAAVEGLASEDYVTEQIAAIEIPEAPEPPEAPDLSGYASQDWVLDQGYVTEQPITDGDEATLKSANDYTDEQIGAIEFPEGVDLSKYAETTYVDGADQAVQRYATTADESVLQAAKSYTDTEAVAKMLQLAAQNEVTTNFRIKSGGKTYISAANGELGIYNLREPTENPHAVTKGFADANYLKDIAPVVLKCDQYVTCTTSLTPGTGQFCGLYNTSPGSSTTANPYFGNWNVEIRVDPAKLLNPEGNQLSDMERYTFEGTVTIIDDTGKLYFKGNVHSVSRTNNNPYVDINFGSRVPAFGTGNYNDAEKYIILVEGLESVQPATVNIPED